MLSFFNRHPKATELGWLAINIFFGVLIGTLVLPGIGTLLGGTIGAFVGVVALKIKRASSVSRTQQPAITKKNVQLIFPDSLDTTQRRQVGTENCFMCLDSLQSLLEDGKTVLLQASSENTCLPCETNLGQNTVTPMLTCLPCFHGWIKANPGKNSLRTMVGQVPTNSTFISTRFNINDLSKAGKLRRLADVMRHSR